MAKRIHLENWEEPEQILLLGIASDERIWKLCWEINQLLEIDMKAVEREVHDTKTEPFQEWTVDHKLFSFSTEEDNIFYQDDKSRKDQDFLLFSARFTERSKSLRAFRYLFVIRYEGELLIEKEKLLNIINSSSIILSAVDLTDYNDLNPQLP
ncbi:MAG: hypothetical protein AAF694_13630 [Bacteroidota bacterium]